MEGKKTLQIIVKQQVGLFALSCSNGDGDEEGDIYLPLCWLHQVKILSCPWEVKIDRHLTFSSQAHKTIILYISIIIFISAGILVGNVVEAVSKAFPFCQETLSSQRGGHFGMRIFEILRYSISAKKKKKHSALATLIQ